MCVRVIFMEKGKENAKWRKMKRKKEQKRKEVCVFIREKWKKKMQMCMCVCGVEKFVQIKRGEGKGRSEK